MARASGAAESGTVSFVIRHADAGARGAIADDARALSDKGRAQAEAIAKALRKSQITALASSPYVRCVETIAPLGVRLGLRIESRDDLAEGAGGAPALALIEACTAPIAICSHGDVIGDLIRALDRRGVPLDDDRIAKASTWALTVSDGEVVAAHYLAPPKLEAW